ncbi:MAG TPA: class I SAM-dependent methyltransferase [Pyrinomonadaceae bacterium]|nr:class I SAM-dependent methyltransferase [Pyrinomonadaceae bacterium]
MAFGHAHYFGVGLTAARSVKEAADAVGLVPRRVLDFPCGYGRVLRYLMALYPNAHFVASDIEREAVDFCARGLKAEGVYSSENLSEVRLGEPFDLIWVGSLLTHFDEAKTREAVAFFGDNLAAGGLLVFTSHGEGAARRMRSKTLDYGVGEEGAARLLTSYADGGHGFEAYDFWPGYGISLTSPAWIRGLMSGWREVYFGDQACDNHHDVFGFVKS